MNPTRSVINAWRVSHVIARAFGHEWGWVSYSAAWSGDEARIQEEYETLVEASEDAGGYIPGLSPSIGHRESTTGRYTYAPENSQVSIWRPKGVCLYVMWDPLTLEGFADSFHSGPEPLERHYACLGRLLAALAGVVYVEPCELTELAGEVIAKPRPGTSQWLAPSGPQIARRARLASDRRTRWGLKTDQLGRSVPVPVLDGPYASPAEAEEAAR